MWALWHMYAHRNKKWKETADTHSHTVYTAGSASTGKFVDSWGNVLLLTYHTP